MSAAERETNGPGETVIIGAGPAGLTAAYELVAAGHPCTILESDGVVGGISRTVERDGWRFDIGGHRFFTKVPRVESFWHKVLSDDDFMMRPRMSRIYYNGKFFDYPLRAANALRNLGVFEAIACFASYVRVRLNPPKDQSTFEGWVAGRFGWRLYRTFFKTYTEKVWGVPATEIQADWAAQRIKNLSLGTAIVNALMPWRNSRKSVTSLIDEFQYPKYGPGMMWESCARQVESMGGTIRFGSSVVGIYRNDAGVVVETEDGSKLQANNVISSMPIGQLILSLVPTPPQDVVHAARCLKHRDFLTVAVIVNEEYAFPDNWIYVHSPEVQVGRVQNYGSWSPYMVKEGKTCLGLEYFVQSDGDLWSQPDQELVALASAELEDLSLVPSGAVEGGFVVRMPKAYPVYDSVYADALDVIRGYLSESWPEIYPVGRNGMHRYNNQDHSMMTAMVTVDGLVSGTSEDAWQVNVDGDYHEEAGRATQTGTGRLAPTFG